MDEIKKLYELYSKDIYKYLLSLTMDVHKAEDIMQNTFVTAIGSLKTFKGHSTVKTWLIGIARNEYYTYRRKNPVSLPIEQAVDFPDTEGSYREYIKQSCTDALLEISKLPEIQRQIVILRLVNEFSFSEIAGITGQSENYCRVSFFRAKNKLWEVLKDE